MIPFATVFPASEPLHNVNTSMEYTGEISINEKINF